MAVLLATVVALVTVLTLLNRLAKVCALLTGRVLPPSPRASDLGPRLPRLPSVSVHVAVRNEDPCVVLETLSSLAILDYPDYHVIVVDNNTTIVELWQPVEAFCASRPDRFTFYHVDQLSGYKAGALNYALERTPPAASVIAIVDADIIVEPQFLQAIVPHFADSAVAIVQSPLGFRRDPRADRFTAWIYLIYRYFLSIYMPAAARFHRAPFIGAMGLVRRAALEECGGWNGFYLTEDMELSCRLFHCGYVSRFVDQVYGRSMPPTDLKNFKRQHYRWNFGNAQIFRDRLLMALSFRGKPRVCLRGRLAYLACPGIYLNLYLLPFALVAVAFQVADVMNTPIPGDTLSCAVMLAVLGTELAGEALMFAILGAYEGVSWLDRLRNLVAWWALSLNNARSTWGVCFRRTRPFEVTEKGERSTASGSAPKSLELLFASAALGFGFVPSLTCYSEWSMASLVLGVIAAMVLTIVFLPAGGGKE